MTIIHKIQRWIKNKEKTSVALCGIVGAPVTAEKYNILFAAYLDLEQQRLSLSSRLHASAKDEMKRSKEVAHLNRIIAKLHRKIERMKEMLKHGPSGSYATFRAGIAEGKKICAANGHREGE